MNKISEFIMPPKWVSVIIETVDVSTQTIILKFDQWNKLMKQVYNNSEDKVCECHCHVENQLCSNLDHPNARIGKCEHCSKDEGGRTIWIKH